MNASPGLAAPRNAGWRDHAGYAGAAPGDAGATPGDDSEWRRRAACASEDLELFFPVGSEGPALTQIAAAKDICARCPVREACLRYAVTTGQAYGIWGGLTADERRGLRYREQSSGPPHNRHIAPWTLARHYKEESAMTITEQAAGTALEGSLTGGGGVQ